VLTPAKVFKTDSLATPTCEDVIDINSKRPAQGE